MKPNHPLLRDEFFKTCKEEWRYLKEYHAMAGSYPNRATFQTQFPDWEFMDTEHTAFWLAEEFGTQHIELQLNGLLDEAQTLNSENPREALEHLRDETKKLLPYLATSANDSGNLFDVQADLEEQMRRRTDVLGAGITHGFGLLDNITKGTQKGELEAYFARPGVGKTFVLLYGALEAAKQGRKVVFFSPEMDRFEVGVRFQSFLFHTSAIGLFSGRLPDQEWQAHIEAVTTFENDTDRIMFYEPGTFGRKFTTSDIAAIVHSEKPDLVCIDGIMLIDPSKEETDIRKRIILTMAELKELAVDSGVPIRFAHQANRQIETGRKSRTIEDIIPHLSHMAESGSVEQYSNRVFALARHQESNTLYIAVRKNRNGRAGDIIGVTHEVDTGRFRDEIIARGDTDLEEIQVQQQVRAQVNPAQRF